MKESEIKFKVSLDNENIPDKIEWDADEKEKEVIQKQNRLVFLYGIVSKKTL